MKLTSSTCYLPNAAKLMPLGFAPDGTDNFGRRVYMTSKCAIAVDCAEGASGEVTIWLQWNGGAVGRRFTGLLLSEEFFDQLLQSVGFEPEPAYVLPHRLIP